MHPDLNGAHSAVPLLARLQKEGAPAVLSSRPWSSRVLHARTQRGSHQSCLEFLEFLREELLDFTKKGFWDVDDALRPIYEEASEVVGREFKYPGDK